MSVRTNITLDKLEQKIIMSYILTDETVGEYKSMSYGFLYIQVGHKLTLLLYESLVTVHFKERSCHLVCWYLIAWARLIGKFLFYA